MHFRAIAALVFACLLLAPARAQDVPLLENPPAVEPPPIDWLQWMNQLEAQGARVGRIRISPRNIFDLSDPREDNFLYRLANGIHVVTRPEQIEKTLLFKSGDPLSVRLIEESERLLRSTLQVYAAYIRPVSYNDGLVDLEVVTRDRWTLDPSVSFSRTGGTNSDRVSIKESNLFGTGTSIAFARTSNVDRTSDTFTISHPHALGPFTSARYAYGDTSDGRTWAAGLERPFYALDARSAWSVGADSSTRSEPVYIGGVNTGTYRHEQSNAIAYYGTSGGLVDGWTKRHSFGYMYQDNNYASIPGESPAGALPSDLILSAPFYRFQIVQDRFRTGANYDSIGKPEDFNLGLDFLGQIGRSISWLGSNRQQWLYLTTISRGLEIGERGQLRTKAEFSGRYGSGGEQQESKFETRYFHRHTVRYTFYAALTANMVRNPDAPNPLTLGGDNDLRGYPLRYQSGNKSVLVNIEERAYTDWYPFRLVRVGGAVFYDGGRAWGGTAPNTGNSGWLNNVGFGLRFLTDRSAVGNVLHIDVAFPLNRAEGIEAVQLLVYTRVNL